MIMKPLPDSKKIDHLRNHLDTGQTDGRTETVKQHRALHAIAPADAR